MTPHVVRLRIDPRFYYLLRQERRKPQMMTFFLDTSAARGQMLRPEMATRDLDIAWRREPTPPPPEPPRFQPVDPNITPISLDRLLREFESPKLTPPTKSKSIPGSTHATPGQYWLLVRNWTFHQPLDFRNYDEDGEAAARAVQDVNYSLVMTS